MSTLSACRLFAATLLAALGAAVPAQAEQAWVGTRVLSFELAQRLAVEAAQACRKQGYQVAVAVVDRSGTLLAFARDPLAGPHTVAVSQGKAYAAATFQTPTTEMMDNEHLRHAPDVLLIGGGLPVRVAGHMYGAVGVSGAPAQKRTGDVDEACAQAGIDAIRESLEFAE
ncbi:MAG: hypothetical protein AMJ69_08525 [Gammaproteobacteria bacterium SG8_47]|nr:MAG: hypothetical protein AMJ69_08525 [Gammaproteobacteria bacterium SG8_47]